MIKVLGKSDDDPPIFALRLTGRSSRVELDEWLGDTAEVSAIRIHLEDDASLTGQDVDALSRRHGVHIAVAAEGTGELSTDA